VALSDGEFDTLLADVARQVRAAAIVAQPISNVSVRTVGNLLKGFKFTGLVQRFKFTKQVTFLREALYTFEVIIRCRRPV
jgi:hypothetical protein